MMLVFNNFLHFLEKMLKVDDIFLIRLQTYFMTYTLTKKKKTYTLDIKVADFVHSHPPQQPKESSIIGPLYFFPLAPARVSRVGIRLKNKQFAGSSNYN